MSSQQQGTAFPQNEDIPWLLRFCQWLWRRPFPFLWFAIIINMAVNIGSTWLITPSSSTTVPETSFLGGVFAWVSARWLLSGTIAVISGLLLAFTWLGSRLAKLWPSMPVPMQISAHDREYLLRRLRLRYEQMLSQSLQGAVQVDLGLASRPAALHNAVNLAWHLPEQPEQLLPSGTSIIDVYTQANQELLLLGEPGAGKSTLLLELAHHLTDQSEQDTERKIPILFPLSTWAVKRLPLQNWLIEQFTLLYAIPEKLSKQWVQSELILPLLDGLDEMEEVARPACIEAINAYHREHLGALVVCSRTQEYDTATHQERLILHSAVVIQPLSIIQVDAHLATLGKPLAGLRNALKKQPTLQALATTPLMLQVLMLTYHGTAVRALPQQTGRLQEQIWMDYIQRMVMRKGDTRRYPQSTTIRRLTWLASYMRQHNQSVFFLELLQPDWLPKKQQALYQRSAGMVLVLFFDLCLMLFSGLFILLINKLANDTTIKLIGKILTLSPGFFIGQLIATIVLGIFPSPFMLSRLKSIQPVGAIKWSRRNFKYPKLLGSLGFVLPFGLMVGLVSGLAGGLTAGLSGGLVSSLIIVLFIWLVAGFSREQLSERLILSPNEGIWRSLKNGLLLFVSSLLLGLIVGLIFALMFRSTLWLVVGLTFGVTFGASFGLPFGLEAFFLHYTLRFWLICTHNLPWRPISFLEDATARILLRRVGGGYSFTHRMLLDYLANLAIATLSTASSATSSIPPSP